MRPPIYRPVRRRSSEFIEVWPASISLGEPLPLLPLFVNVDLAVQVDFEVTNQETCQRLRLDNLA